MIFDDSAKELPCKYCGDPIYFDDNRFSRRTGAKYPLEPETGARHQCQEYYDAKERQRDEQVKREYREYRQRSKENLERFNHERRILRKGKKRTDEHKSNDSRISINENSDEKKPLIEYRPPDFNEW